VFIICMISALSVCYATRLGEVHSGIMKLIAAAFAVLDSYLQPIQKHNFSRTQTVLIDQFIYNSAVQYS
jgi:23S rRNA A2030 N6-methylase RlmJ